MKTVSEISNVLPLRSRPRHGEHVELDERGFPADRTLCPWCHGKGEDCKRCDGRGMVCPVCRGAHVMNVKASDKPLTVACEACTDWASRPHEWDEHRWPKFKRDAQREARAIQTEWHVQGRGNAPF